MYSIHCAFFLLCFVFVLVMSSIVIGLMWMFCPYFSVALHTQWGSDMIDSLRYPQTSNIRHTLVGIKNCWSPKCRRCSYCIFILDLKSGFNGIGIYNCKTRFKVWDLVSYTRGLTVTLNNMCIRILTKPQNGKILQTVCIFLRMCCLFGTNLDKMSHAVTLHSVSITA